MSNPILKWLRNRRQRVEEEFVTIEERRYLSAIFYVHARYLAPMIHHYSRGELIDLGCGTSPFWPVVQGRVDRYVGVDLWPRSDKVSFAADIQSLEMIPDRSFDSAICIEVLEHLPEPWRAIETMARILKPGGVVVITVPHLSRLHEIPHDYFRFTEYGLRSMLSKAGMEILSLQPKGGLILFLAHQVSTVLLALAWTIPFVKRPLLFFNRWVLVIGAYYLDRLFGMATTFPQGYIVVARRILT